MAEKLNAAGYTQKSILELFMDGFEHRPTQQSVKELFQALAYAKTGKRKTSELTTVEMQEVYEDFDAEFYRVTRVSLPWPSKEEQMLKDYEEMK